MNTGFYLDLSFKKISLSTSHFQHVSKNFNGLMILRKHKNKNHALILISLFKGVSV